MISMTVPIDLSELTGCYHVECLRCLTPLALHQPDIDSPDRILGVCCDCQAWYLLDSLAGLMAQLPELSELEDGFNVKDIHS